MPPRRQAAFHPAAFPLDVDRAENHAPRKHAINRLHLLVLFAPAVKDPTAGDSIYSGSQAPSCFSAPIGSAGLTGDKRMLHHSREAVVLVKNRWPVLGAARMLSVCVPGGGDPVVLA